MEEQPPAESPPELEPPKLRLVFDPIKQGIICGVIAAGGSRRTAALYVGCASTTITRTAARDEVFRKKLEHAESHWEVYQLANIQRAGKEGKYWRAAAWALERKYPDRYAQRTPGTVSSERIKTLLDQFAAIVVQEVTTAPERQRILERLRALAKECA